VTALNLELSLPAEWSKIDPTREAVGLLVLALFGNDDLRDALAMVSEELLENAIKYSRPGSTVGVAITDSDGGVVIAVTNVVDESSRHLTHLRERIDWIATFPSAADAYGAALARVYERKDRTETGLGIARIAYEGRCHLELELSVPGRVTVTARCPRPDDVPA
jgi:hypothetical protein